jgi:hypothetical protein
MCLHRAPPGSSGAASGSNVPSIAYNYRELNHIRADGSTWHEPKHLSLTYPESDPCVQHLPSPDLDLIEVRDDEAAGSAERDDPPGVEESARHRDDVTARRGIAALEELVESIGREVTRIDRIAITRGAIDPRARNKRHSPSQHVRHQHVSIVTGCHQTPHAHCLSSITATMCHLKTPTEEL